MAGDRRNRLLVIGALLGLLAATNRWLSWAAGYRLLTARDELDYRAIAHAAPRLPHQRLAEQHAQRFAYHWLIGELAHGLGTGVETVYAVGAVVLAIAVCLLLWLALERLSLPAFVICLAAFALDAYSLRYYWLAPGELGDLIFEGWFLVTIAGLIRGRLEVVLAGVVGATLARQTMVPPALVAAWWVWAGPGWRDAARRRRGAAMLAVAIASVATFIAESRVAAPFSYGTTPDLAHFTLLADLARLPAGLGTLAEHGLRSVNALFAVSALLAVAGRRRLPFAFWGCLALGAAVSLQPLVFSPQYAAHNESRLACLGLGAFVVALGIALAAWEREEAIAPRTATIIVALLAVGSLHHLYTVVGTASAAQTAVLQFVVAIGVAIVLRRARGAVARAGLEPASLRL